MISPSSFLFDHSYYILFIEVGQYSESNIKPGIKPALSLRLWPWLCKVIMVFTGWVCMDVWMGILDNFVGQNFVLWLWPLYHGAINGLQKALKASVFGQNGVLMAFREKSEEMQDSQQPRCAECREWELPKNTAIPMAGM